MIHLQIRAEKEIIVNEYSLQAFNYPFIVVWPSFPLSFCK